jgi:hypothetical protein
MPVDAATKYLAAYRSGSLEWGPFKVGPDIIEGIRRIKAIDGPGLNPRGQFDSDIDAARRGADQILLVVCPILSDKENVCVRQNLAKRTRTDQHEPCVLWRPHQHQRACLRTGSPRTQRLERMPKLFVHRFLKILVCIRVSFSGQDRNMSKEELNLFQLSDIHVAKFSRKFCVNHEAQHDPIASAPRNVERHTK